MKTSNLFPLASVALLFLGACASLPPEYYAVAAKPGDEARIVDGYAGAIDDVMQRLETILRNDPAGKGICKVEVDNVPNPKTYEREIRIACLGRNEFDDAVLTAARQANDLSVPRYRYTVSTPQYRGALNWQAKAGRTTVTRYFDVPPKTPISYGEPYEREAALHGRRRHAPTGYRAGVSAQRAQAKLHQEEAERLNPARIAAIVEAPAAVPVPIPPPLPPGAVFTLPAASGEIEPIPPATLPKPLVTSFKSWVDARGKEGWTLPVQVSAEPIPQNVASTFDVDQLLAAKHTGDHPRPFALLLLPTPTEPEAIDLYMKATGGIKDRPPSAYKVQQMLDAGVE